MDEKETEVNLGSPTENSVSVFAMTDIGFLILEELRSIRKDMREEMKLISNRMDTFFQSMHDLKSDTSKNQVQENKMLVNKGPTKGMKLSPECRSLSSQRPLDDRARELKAWGEKLFSKAKLENEKELKAKRLAMKHHQDDTLLTSTEHFSKKLDTRVKNNLMETQSSFDSDDDGLEIKHTSKAFDEVSCGKNIIKMGEESDAAVVTPMFDVFVNSSKDKAKKKNPFMETLVGQNLYQCQICNKRYVNQRDVKRHMRSHTGERPFSCTDCEKSFYRQEHLKVHIRTHTGERPYQCDFCDKAFSRSGDLKVHIRTHTGEKPFQCKLCDKGFVKRGDLKRHAKTHANTGPFECPICMKVFAKLSTLNKHVELHLDNANGDDGKQKDESQDHPEKMVIFEQASNDALQSIPQQQFLEDSSAVAIDNDASVVLNSNHSPLFQTAISDSNNQKILSVVSTKAQSSQLQEDFEEVNTPSRNQVAIEMHTNSVQFDSNNVN